MRSQSSPRKYLLMIAYTYYRSDPRVIREAEAALTAGFKVDFLALRGPDDPPVEWIRGVKVIHLSQSRYRGSGPLRYLSAYFVFFVRCFFKTIRQQLAKGYKVVHVHNMPDFMVFCALLPKMMGAKVLLDIHDPMPNTFVSKFKSSEHGPLFRLLLWEERLSAAFADKVLTVHDPVKDYILVNQHGLAAGSIQVIANFADDGLFSLQAPRRFDAGLQFVFHGTILERYGLGDVLSAVAAMEHKDRITVKIIGDGDYSKDLRKLIELHELGSIVDFDNHIYPVQVLPEMLKAFNVGLVPLEISSITNYALPLKLLEYLSLGMPSITVSNKAIGYYFGEDDLLYYRPGDPDSLRLLLDRLVASPDILGRYQQRAVALRGNFLWSREKQKYVSMLKSMSGR